jgi:hypothetical protein
MRLPWLTLMSGFVHSCELKGLWLLAQRLTNVSLYKYREFDV